MGVGRRAPTQLVVLQDEDAEFQTSEAQPLFHNVVIARVSMLECPRYVPSEAFCE